MDASALNPPSSPPAHCAVCIIGGNLAALTLARLLQPHLPPSSVHVVDAAPPPSPAAGGGGGDAGKTIVIHQRAAECLRQLDALPASSRAITRVHISRRGLGGAHIGSGTRPLAHAIAPQEVAAKLRQGLAVHHAKVHAVTADGDGVQCTAEDGTTWRAALTVIACPLPQLPPPFKVRQLTYRQTILSLTARADLPPGTARQRYSRRRILVLVPSPGADTEDRIGVILCAPAADAGALNALSDAELSHLLSEEFSLPLQVSGRRFAYTPHLARRTPLAAPPLLLLGSGASSLHPVGAQAITLAIEDAACLADVFAKHGNGVIPSAEALRGYGARRRRAHAGVAVLTSTLALGAFGAGGVL